jgi:hypothetical protein
MVNATHLARCCGGEIDSRMYREMFPNVPMRSQKFKSMHSKLLSERNTQNWKDSDYAARHAKISSDTLKKTHHKHAKLLSAKSSRVLRNRNNKNWSRPKYRAKMVKLLTANAVTQWSTYREKQTEAVLSGRRRGWRKYTNRAGNTIHLRSSYELRFAILLDLLQLDWQYEEYRFVESDGGCYVPDFYLVKYRTFVEVKGWITSCVHERLSAVRAAHDIKLVMFGTEELKQLSVFDFKDPGKLVTFDLKRFNDYPVAGSRGKRSEVRRILESLLGL